MLMRFHSLLFFFLTVNNTLDVEAIVARLQTRYHSVRTLQATFLERYRENGRVVRVEAGTAYFRRPGKMRWEYQAPEKNVFLVDGNTAWFYVPADHTATRVPAKESAEWRPCASAHSRPGRNRNRVPFHELADESPGAGFAFPV